METINIKLEDIIPYKNNAKKHNRTQINNVAESIKQFGMVQPIVLDKNNEIVIGHCRYEALKKLGEKEAPCVMADDLTEEQIKKLRNLDNKLNESEWDYDLLKFDIEDLDFSDFDIDWEIPDLDFEEKETEEDDFDIELPVEPKSKLGDIYQLGNHRLMCGDSTSITDIDKLLNDNKIDMIFTDPPYGMNLDTDFSGMKSKILKGGNGGNEYDAGIVDDFSPEMINTIMALDIKETFLWGADYFAELLPNKNDGSWVVWDKRANGNDDIAEDYSSDKMYGSCFELCWSRTKHKRDIARVKWAGMFGMKKQDNKKRLHPTQKPLELCNWFITRYSEDNSNILDLFGGSGSTLIACEQLNRNAYLMELEPKWVDVIIQRWEKFTGKKAVLLNE